MFSDGEFTAFHNNDFAPNNTAVPTQVLVSESNKGPVVFSSSAFWGPSNNIAQLYGSGTTTFNPCQFVEWDGYAKNGAPGIYARGGNVIIQGCTFQKSGAQVQFVKGTQKAIITGNILEGDWKGVIDDSVNVAKANNL